MVRVRYTRSFSIGNDGNNTGKVKGQIEEVSEEEATGFFRFGWAEPADIEFPVKTEHIEASADEPAPAVPEDNIELPHAEEPELPKPYAAKSAWIEYGIAQGDDEEELKVLTKAELQSRYGDRL